MSDSATDDILRLARAVNAGSRDAIDQLLPRVYEELRGIAVNFLRSERNDHTLQPTALVHEAYLRLLNQRSVGWEDRTHFFAAAATVMRRILVDHARAHKAAKRGGGRRRTALDDAVALFEKRALDLVGLDQALEKLGKIDERKSRIVELRFFGGLTVDETSKVLDIRRRTVEREWTLAKAWLRGELQRCGIGRNGAGAPK